MKQLMETKKCIEALREKSESGFVFSEACNYFTHTITDIALVADGILTYEEFLSRNKHIFGATR